MSTAEGLEVRQVTSRRDRHDWLMLPFAVHGDDPAWVPPLLLAERQRISPRHNPFFTFGEAALFLAYRAGRPVGRISAQVNRRHLAQHDDATGQFGFFECHHDADAASALVAAAARWLAERGLKRMQGPFSLSINEDVGLLVSGFESPPAILTSHARPWYGPLLEQAGLAKAMDLYAYRMDPRSVPTRAHRLADLATQSSRVKVRSFDMKRYPSEVALVFEIYNDAWSENWGFVPFSDAEIAALTRETRLFMRSEFGRIVEIDGKPAAMMVILPDLNTIIRRFRGRLLPFNWLRLLHGIRFDRCTAARIALLGLAKEHRTSPLGPAVLSLLARETVALGQRYQLDWLEFSWVLETNRPMVALAELAAGPPCKVYRVYQKPI